MAINSQGISVTWGVASLTEVVSVSIDGVQSDVVEITPRSTSSRDKLFRAADIDRGTVTVRCRGTAQLSVDYVNLAGPFSISGPGVGFTCSNAIFQSLAWNAIVGELQEWTAVFKITE